MAGTIKNYLELAKFRLSTTVAATAAFGYILAVKLQSTGMDWKADFNWVQLCGLLFAGMLITFSANGFNQIIEKEQDRLMSRTEDRPIAAGRLSEDHARVFCFATGIVGILLFGFFTTFAATVLALVSMIIYIFIYTPMKSQSPTAVMVGAIPGALPPLIGYAAYTGRIDNLGMIFFLIQFFWQFPHFWSIAWILHDDYMKANYWLLPSKGGRDQGSALKIFYYTLVLVLASLVPYYYHIVATWAMIIILVMGLLFIQLSVNLIIKKDLAAARKMMFFSFLYTPVVFIVLILG